VLPSTNARFGPSPIDSQTLRCMLARMGDAYTPGLTVTAATVVRKTRQLPLPGRVLKAVGDSVLADDVVATTMLPGKVALTNVATAVGAMPDEVQRHLVVAVGDSVIKGKIIAKSESFFGWFKSEARSPVDGTLESMSATTGMARSREPTISVDVKA